MKIYRVTGSGEGEFAETETPIPEDDQLLIRIVYCGICGTDYALFSGNNGFVREGRVTYPMRLGHEWSGIVEKVGPAVTGFKSGDRVIGDNAVSCGKCKACLDGDYANCENVYNVGTIDPAWPGAFAEYVIYPQRHVYRISDNVPLIDAALVEPVSVAYGGIRKMNITPSSVVAVIGTGCIAMAAAALAKAKGSENVYVIGRNSFKLEKAASLGIAGTIDIHGCDPCKKLSELTGGRLADFVLECSGAPSSFNTAIHIAEKRASVSLIAFYEEILKESDINLITTKELTVFGVMGEYGNAEASLGIMEKCDLQMNKCITQTVDFAEFPDALRQTDTSKRIKTMVRISNE